MINEEKHSEITKKIDELIVKICDLKAELSKLHNDIYSLKIKVENDKKKTNNKKL